MVSVLVACSLFAFAQEPAGVLPPERCPYRDPLPAFDRVTPREWWRTLGEWPGPSLPLIISREEATCSLIGGCFPPQHRCGHCHGQSEINRRAYELTDLHGVVQPRRRVFWLSRYSACGYDGSLAL